MAVYRYRRRARRIHIPHTCQDAILAGEQVHLNPTAERPPAEIIFLVEEAPEGGYTARALSASIFTEADDLDSLHANVRDAVACHFGDSQGPSVIRLHFVKEEVLTP